MAKFQRAFLRIALATALSATVALSQSAPEALTPDVRAALERISANSMRGHLSFIASDLLEGRDTPSRGLDLAAEYIAAQFRRAGLEPAGDDGYFQTANWVTSELDASNFQLTFQSGAKEVHASASQVSFTPNARQALTLAGASVIKIQPGDSAALAAFTPAQMQGKVVMTEPPDPRDPAAAATNRAFIPQLQALRPAVLVTVNRQNPTGGGGGPAQLVDPETRQQPSNAGNAVPATVLLTLHAPEAVALYDSLPSGVTTATFSLRTAMTDKPARVRNVIGVLRGSDATLKDTFVFVTAHYDHVGMSPVGNGDRISNGANDDGSGTVSVMEIASALATLPQRPKRSIVFMTVFGEEKGLLGSRYYSRHPIFPIARTVANINLEQVGRTDSTEGPQVGTASLTGFDFSSIGAILQTAGEATGIRVYKHPTNSDSYFGRSDNQSFATLGIPAHTLCVAFNYPDYHRVSDHWEKVDYENMAKVDRMVALAVLMIATNPQEPQWDETNARTAQYVRAWKAQHP